MCIIVDPPRKRIDTRQLNGQSSRLSLGNISEGSPLSSRRALAIHTLFVNANRPIFLTFFLKKLFTKFLFSFSRRKNSLVSSLSQPGSPSPSPRAPHRSLTNPTPPHSPSQTPPTSPSMSSSGAWRSRLSTLKQSFLGTPRFHRRNKYHGDSVDTVTPDASPE